MFLKYTFETINSDLKFAETKNTFLATVNLAIIGWVVSFVFSDETQISMASRCCFIVFLMVVIISTFVSVLSFLPALKFRKMTRTKLDNKDRFMFYKYNRNKYGDNDEKFEEAIKRYFSDEEYTPVEKQLIGQILDLSSVVYSKCMCFSVALFIELISFLVLIFSICL